MKCNQLPCLNKYQRPKCLETNTRRFANILLVLQSLCKCWSGSLGGRGRIGGWRGATDCGLEGCSEHFVVFHSKPLKQTRWYAFAAPVRFQRGECSIRGRVLKLDNEIPLSLLGARRRSLLVLTNKLWAMCFAWGCGGEGLGCRGEADAFPTSWVRVRLSHPTPQPLPAHL